MTIQPRLFYCDHYQIPLPSGHKFPMAKYRLLREALAADGVYRLDPAHPAGRETVMTAHDEFIPDDRLDMAAARIAAMITPVMPAGSPTSTNRGNSLSAPTTRLSVWEISSGWAVK